MLNNFNSVLVKSVVDRGINNLIQQYRKQHLTDAVRKFTRTIQIKLTAIERLEIRYIDKPNIRHWFPFLNIYIIMFSSILICVFSILAAYKYTFNIIASICIGFIIASFLYIGLDTITKVNGEKVRKIMASWISSLNRWADIKTDIVYIFEKSLESLPEPLRSYVSDCVIQLNNGLGEYEALDILSMKVDSDQFKDFILNLKQNRRHGGDLKVLLENIEEEFTQLEEEYVRCKISNASGRISTYMMMLFVIAVGYYLIQTNLTARQFYMHSEVGKVIISAFMIVYFMAFVYSTKISNFNY